MRVMWLTARASAARERAQRGEAGRLQAHVSQRPACWKDAIIPLRFLSLARRTRLLNLIASDQRPHLLPAFALCHFTQCSAGLLAVGFARCGETRAFGLLTCLHDVALQATRSCVVGVTPSATPPRWFLVMEVSALPCHCPQLPFSCACS